MEIRNESITAPKTIDITNLSNNDVYFGEGSKIGKIKSIHLDPKSLTLSGIKVYGGIFNQEHYISRSFISEMNENDVVLSLKSLEYFNGKLVVEKKGKKRGIIDSINITPEGMKVIAIEKGEKYEIEESQILRLGEICIIKAKSGGKK